MRVNPVENVGNVAFRGFAPMHNTPDGEVKGINGRYPFPTESRIFGGILLREHPEPKEGVGEKLDIIA